MAATTIYISPSGKERTIREALTSEIIKPGHLVERNSTTIRKHNTAGGKAEPIFLLEDLTQAGDIDTTVPSGDTGRFTFAQSGDQINGIVAAATPAIAANADLISDGDGGLKTAIAETAALLFVDGAAANGGVTYTSLLPGDVGNDIAIVQDDAGTGGVTIDGLTISVVPDTGANTATAVVAQIAADEGASKLVAAVAEGDGSGEPGVVTITNLAGGLNASGAEAIVGSAIAAVDNSGGSADARITVEVK